MNKKIVITLAVLIIVGFGIYYTLPKKSAKNIPIDTSSIVPAQNIPAPIPASIASTTISIKNFSFSPSTLTIKTGTKVTWVNDDATSHTVTSDSGNLLNSPILSSGESFSFTFTNTGSTSYHCSIHPSMKGSVVVQN